MNEVPDSLTVVGRNGRQPSMSLVSHSPNGPAPDGPHTITVGAIPQIYALYRPDEGDEIVAWAVTNH